MPSDNTGKIYSATYSNVPVYEFNVEGNHVMRRRADDWINATHILKVADFDKPARTRILEREVQKGVHEKVQGGYGKYQGTWVPLHDGRALAERNGVLNKLLPIFDFVPGDRSPPPAPKHATAASSRPRAPRQAAPVRRLPATSQISEDLYDNISAQYNEDDAPDNDTIMSESMMDDEMMHNPQYSGASRKRKRGVDHMSWQDQEHQIWADKLLDYFMLADSEDRLMPPPEPEPTINLDRPIDEKGHSALHWAAAMGDVEVVKDLIRRGARTDCLSNNLETPLMRAVMFTNNYDKNIMPKMVRILQNTVTRTDWFGCTVFHHIAATTSSKTKYLSARYYLDSIINVLAETWIPDAITKLLNAQDQNGDTAIMIAARNGARKCVRSLLGRNAAVDIPNHRGETADDLIRELNARRQQRGGVGGVGLRQASSSPFAPDGRGANGDNAAVIPTSSSLYANANPYSTTTQRYRSQTATTLMHKLAPSVLEKLSQLASAYDAEIERAEAEAAEAERVARRRQAEIEAVRRQVAELRGAMADAEGDEDGGGDVETEQDAAQEAELGALVRESEALLEVEQRAELARLVAEEEAKARQQQHPASLATNGGDGLAEKTRLAASLYRAQAERRALVLEIVQDLSVAGVGEQQREYRRLITGALGVREEDVEGMLEDILAELEEAREREVLEASPV